MNTNSIVAEIHNDFATAQDRILQECNDVLNNPKVDVALKSERVSKLGFRSSKIVTDATELAKKHQEAPALMERVNYFRQHYPFNKFITETEVKKLCEKYGLLLGDTGHYIGDIPDKNIDEIENFKLREEDFSEEEVQYLHGSDIWSRMFNELEQYLGGFDPIRYETKSDSVMASGLAAYISSDKNTKEEKPKMKKADLKIVASVKDFDTSRMQVTDGYKLEHIPDPIVLQPVIGGYLIVSKWGLEASDEIAVNQAMN
jgi:hypothetical protein